MVTFEFMNRIKFQLKLRFNSEDPTDVLRAVFPKE